jgi:DNA-binding XRE family transcriptional regulator
MRTKKKTISASQVFKGRSRPTFGTVLRAWRLAEEMNQTQMAKFLGISRANLCDIEKGRKLPSPSRAVKIARKLGMLKSHAIELVLQDTLDREHIKLKVSVAA